MKERPILFKGDMVRAILAGRKTQTRRVVTPSNSSVLGYNVKADNEMWTGLDFSAATVRKFSIWGSDMHLSVPWKHADEKDYSEEVHYRVRPRWDAGDRLWVKETHWRYGRWVKNGKTKTGRQKWKFKAHNNEVHYPDDSSREERDRIEARRFAPKDRTELAWRKRPSIFMPRWASRITLEIVAVRVERLHEISEADAEAEGTGHNFVMNGGWPDYLHIDKAGHCTLTHDSARMSYSTLWESINGKGAWELNPWVWAIEFRKL